MKGNKMFTIIINGQRSFVFQFTMANEKAYLWTEGFIMGKGHGWEFDDYNYETDDCLLRVKPF